MEPLSERSSRVVSYAKLHRAAARREQKQFLVEGTNSVEAALTSGRALRLLVAVDEYERHSELIEQADSSGVPVELLTARAAGKLAETTTAPGVFALCELLDVTLKAILGAAPQLLAVAVEPREPGNVGTLIRCADAMGAAGLLLLGDAADPHNGKCVRSSAGSIFHLPVVRERNTETAIDRLKNAGLVVLATTMDGETSLDDLPVEQTDGILAGPTAWLFGNEAHGLSAAVAARAHWRVRIPIRGRAESLNVAAAAAICLYQSARAQG